MTSDRPDLFLHEQILLLALRDDRGTIESRAGWYSLALGGAILSELVVDGRIRIEEGKKKLVEVVERRPFGDEVLDECLERVASSKRRRKAADWVSSFSRVKRLRYRIAEGLCRRGILKDREDTVLLLFKRKVYPTLDPVPERRLRETIRRAVLRDTKTVAPHATVLIALANATGLLRVVLDRKEIRAHKKRLDAIVNGDLVGGAVRDAVQAAQTAAVVAAMVATTAAATATTSH